MFALNRDVTLINTLSHEHQIVWKLYEGMYLNFKGNLFSLIFVII